MVHQAQFEQVPAGCTVYQLNVLPACFFDDVQVNRINLAVKIETCN
jgi:hypothetical protein